MGLTATLDEPLTSWTRTLNEDDAFALVDAAGTGMTLADWSAVGDRLLPQASQARRREQIRIVRDELLDHRDGVLVDSAWGRLFRAGSPHRRRGLLYGRLWRHRPLVTRALDELVHPALDQADRPLAPHDADLVESATWDRFLRTTLRANVPDAAFAKTRSTLQAALRDVGVLDVAGNTLRTTRVRHGRPDPIAFAWVVGHELLGRGRDESEAWAAREAFAARLFAPRGDYAATCIEEGIQQGLLRRGHLMGQSRLHPGPELQR